MRLVDCCARVIEKYLYEQYGVPIIPGAGEETEEVARNSVHIHSGNGKFFPPQRASFGEQFTGSYISSADIALQVEEDISVRDIAESAVQAMVSQGWKEKSLEKQYTASGDRAVEHDEGVLSITSSRIDKEIRTTLFYIRN